MSEQKFVILQILNHSKRSFLPRGFQSITTSPFNIRSAVTCSASQCQKVEFDLQGRKTILFFVEILTHPVWIPAWSHLRLSDMIWGKECKKATFSTIAFFFLRLLKALRRFFSRVFSSKKGDKERGKKMESWIFLDSFNMERISFSLRWRPCGLGASVPSPRKRPSVQVEWED